MRARHVLIALMLACGSARADRYERANALFHGACISCHSVSWNNALNERNRVDLTRVIDRKGDAELARFLADPKAEHASTGCHHLPLLPSQVDDLMAFLRMHASDPPKPAKVAPSTVRIESRPAVYVPRKGGNVPQLRLPSTGGSK